MMGGVTRDEYISAVRTLVAEAVALAKGERSLRSLEVEHHQKTSAYQ